MGNAEQIKKVYNKIGGKWTIIVIVMALLLVIPVRSDGPYRGRVVEENSGRPISGVLVLAYWSHMIPNPGGGTSRCLDATEALTDEKGEFEIPARRSALLRPLGSMTAEFYKIGYKRVAIGEWRSFKADEELIKMVKWDGDRVIIPFTPIAKDELNSTEGSPPFISCGRKNGKPLDAYDKVRQEFQQALQK